MHSILKVGPTVENIYISWYAEANASVYKKTRRVSLIDKPLAVYVKQCYIFLWYYIRGTFSVKQCKIFLKSWSVHSWFLENHEDLYPRRSMYKLCFVNCLYMRNVFFPEKIIPCKELKLNLSFTCSDEDVGIFDQSPQRRPPLTFWSHRWLKCKQL